MIELIGCISIIIISISFICMIIDELRTNYKMRKWYKENNRNNTKNDTTGNNTIFNNSVDNSRNNENSNLFNNEKIERELNKQIDELKTQQKEFMNFLTEAINKLKLEQETSNSAILKANTDLQMEVYSIVLSKYKEIIGDDK